MIHPAPMFPNQEIYSNLIDPEFYPNHERKYDKFMVTCWPDVCNKGVTVIRIALSYLDPEDQPNGLRLNDSNSVFVEFPAKPNTIIEFGICLPVAYGDPGLYRLVEWFEMHKLLGVGRVVIYNQTLDEPSSAVLFHYERQGYVDKEDPYSTHDMRVRNCLSVTDCLYRNLYTFKYIISIDLDEGIVPRFLHTIPELLALIKRNQADNISVASYKFRNVNWPADTILKSELDESKPDQLHYLRYRQRQKVNPIEYHMKHIMDPMGCAVLYQHSCLATVEGYDTLELIVNPTLGNLYHYRGTLCNMSSKKPINCSDAYYMVAQDDIMLRYESELIAGVDRQLRDLGLDAILK